MEQDWQRLARGGIEFACRWSRSEQLGVEADCAERVVNLMRKAGGHAPEQREALRALAQLPLFAQLAPGGGKRPGELADLVLALGAGEGSAGGATDAGQFSVS